MPSNDPSKPGEFKTPERCPHCGGTKLVRRGKRTKKFESAQLWLCKSCTRAFTDTLIRGKSYPARAILDALCWYHQGYTVKETIALLKRRHGYAPHENAIGKWLRLEDGLILTLERYPLLIEDPALLHDVVVLRRMRSTCGNCPYLNHSAYAAPKLCPTAELAGIEGIKEGKQNAEEQ